MNLDQVGRDLRVNEDQGENRYNELDNEEHKHVNMKQEMPHGMLR